MADVAAEMSERDEDLARVGHDIGVCPVAERGRAVEQRCQVVLGGEREGLRRIRAAAPLHRRKQIAGCLVHPLQAASVTRRRSAIPLSRR